MVMTIRRAAFVCYIWLRFSVFSPLDPVVSSSISLVNRSFTVSGGRVLLDLNPGTPNTHSQQIVFAVP
uniref:Putative secreted protein n=1 Tax=Anopheles marajoara TaxID=58244 RepID=A0A2M4CFE4_9DIPT